LAGEERALDTRALENFCQLLFPDIEGLSVSHIQRITDGWECEVFSFMACPPEGPCKDLIIRVYPGHPSSRPDAKCQWEYTVLNTLRTLGYPVPEVYGFSLDLSVAGAPFLVMQRIRGTPLDTVYSDSDPGARCSIVTEFAALQAKLHFYDPAHFDPGRSQLDSQELIAAELNEFERYFSADSQGPMRPVVEWLKDNAGKVTPEKPCLIHLDYHPHNILVRGDGAKFVIDWASARVSDARYDVAWTLLLLGNRDVQSLYTGEYFRISGRSVNGLDYFRVLAATRRLGSILISLRYGPEVLGMRPGAVQPMKHSLSRLRDVYQVVVDGSGIRLPEVEALFDQYD